jgi:hypothetical protein
MKSNIADRFIKVIDVIYHYIEYGDLHFVNVAPIAVFTKTDLISNNSDALSAISVTACRLYSEMIPINK